MKTFEITLNGFDGSTDETDDKIIWAQAPCLGVLKKKLEQMGVSYKEIDSMERPPIHAAIDIIVNGIGYQDIREELVAQLLNEHCKNIKHFIVEGQKENEFEFTNEMNIQMLVETVRDTLYMYQTITGDVDTYELLDETSDDFNTEFDSIWKACTVYLKTIRE